MYLTCLPVIQSSKCIPGGNRDLEMALCVIWIPKRDFIEHFHKHIKRLNCECFFICFPFPSNWILKMI